MKHQGKEMGVGFTEEVAPKLGFEEEQRLGKKNKKPLHVLFHASTRY